MSERHSAPSVKCCLPCLGIVCCLLDEVQITILLIHLYRNTYTLRIYIFVVKINYSNSIDNIFPPVRNSVDVLLQWCRRKKGAFKNKIVVVKQ